ncbi:putative SP-containing membrane protein [Vairimorpha necatrix]|uniref:SP-containing membrane protein n=1 Tax=Vairimorpha necatrix TaxID=6039 RepID=A0AAX4JDR9_9MICR
MKFLCLLVQSILASNIEGKVKKMQMLLSKNEYKPLTSEKPKRYIGEDHQEQNFELHTLNSKTEHQKRAVTPNKDLNSTIKTNENNSHDETKITMSPDKDAPNDISLPKSNDKIENKPKEEQKRDLCYRFDQLFASVWTYIAFVCIVLVIFFSIVMPITSTDSDLDSE